MTSTQITKLAAAGLTVEQIAVVAEVMEAPRFMGAGFGGPWPAPNVVTVADAVAQADLARLERFKKRQSEIETKVQHGDLTVWPEKPKAETTPFGFRYAQQTER